MRKKKEIESKLHEAKITLTDKTNTCSTLLDNEPNKIRTLKLNHYLNPTT